MTDEPQEIQIDTPDGQITAHEMNVEPVPQTIVVVEGDELEWLQSLGEGGPEFVAHFVSNANVEEPSLKDYDAAFRAWQGDESSPYSDDDVIEMIGGYLGNKCIADFDMEWVTVTDEYGTDYAVRGTKVEVMSFPFSTVVKRIVDGQFDFVHGVYYAIKDLLASGQYKLREPNE